MTGYVVSEEVRQQVGDATADAMQEAFEEALVHKVMPKLRGIETDGETKTQCIDKIESVLFGPNGKDGLAPGLQADFEHARKNAYETFIWSSAKYLEIEE